MLKLQPFSGPKWAQGYAINQSKTVRSSTPVGQQLDPEVIAFRSQFDVVTEGRSFKDGILQEEIAAQFTDSKHNI